MLNSNETPRLTIYDFGYSKDLIRTDNFYDDSSRTQSSISNQVNPSNIGGGQITNDVSFGSEGYTGSIYTGNIDWDPGTGLVTGGSGVLFYKGGLIGAAAGVETFRIDSATGAATFAGTLSAPTGNIGGFTIGTDYIRDAANSMGIASTVTGGDDVRFWAGATFANRATAPFRITESGALVATSATISGTITATTGSIGGFDVGADYIRDAANTMGLASTVTGSDDVRFWAGASFASRASAPFKVTEAGAVTGSNITITGGSVASSILNGIIAQGNLNVANRGWTQTCAFSVTDSDTVAWASGTFITADGTSYSISGGNTGNMSARTYIYLDTAVSTTAYQTTTTASAAVGAGKVLIGTAINGTTEARFEVFGGIGGMNIDAANIVAGTVSSTELADLAVSTTKLAANAVTAAKIAALTITAAEIAASTITGAKIAADTITGANIAAGTITASEIAAGTITANEIAASTITAGKLSVSTLSSITADMGALTAGTITLNSSGHIKSGQTNYNTGTGFFLGIHSSTPKFSIGDPSGDHMLWTGTELILNDVSVSDVVDGATADINFGLFRGAYNDGFTSVVSNSTTTRSLLITTMQFSTGSTGWSLISPTFGANMDFTKDMEFFVRLQSDTGLAWASATEGRGYLWGVATGLSNMNQASVNTKARGTDIDQAGFGFIVGGDDNLYAWSSNGQASGLGGIDLTDLSAYVHTDFHNYVIEYHYAALPSISNTGALRPSAHSGGNTNQANMYDANTATFGFYERGSGGDIVRLSYDGGTNFTGSINMTLPVTQGTVTIGGQYETWGRTWTPAEFSNANFRLALGNASGGSDLWNGTFNTAITFSNFGFSTGTWVHITGIKVDLLIETEDEGDGGIAEAKVYDVQVTVYFTTAQGTGYAKFYIDDTLVATHYVGIPVIAGGDPRITFLGGVNQQNTSSGVHTIFNNYRLKITT